MSNPLIDELIEQEKAYQSSVALPSLGRFYLDTDNIFDPDTNFQEVTVNYLSIMDETIYQDPILIASGRAIPKLLRQVCPSILRPEKLCEVDIEAILFAVRFASYGETMKLTHTCQNEAIKPGEFENPDDRYVCRVKNDFDINLIEFINNRYAPFQDMSKFTLVLEDVKQTLFLRPNTYETAIEVMKELFRNQLKKDALEAATDEDMIFNEKKVNLYMEIADNMNKTNVDTLVNGIVSVTSQSGKVFVDREIIKEWLLKLPLTYANEISARLREIAEEMKKLPEVQYDCPHCGHHNTLYIQMDPQKLFTQAEDSETQTNSSAQSPKTGKKGKTQSRISRR